MTNIEFYILKEQSRQDRFFLTCRITEKAWRNKRRVMIHTDTEEEARHLDDLMWTYRDISFLPHALLPAAHADTTPVIIGWSTDAGDESDVLINLSSRVPEFFSRFERVIEPVDNDAERRNVCRDHFRYYRDRGYPLNNQEINS